MQKKSFVGIFGRRRKVSSEVKTFRGKKVLLNQKNLNSKSVPSKICFSVNRLQLKFLVLDDIKSPWQMANGKISYNIVALYQRLWRLPRATEIYLS